MIFAKRNDFWFLEKKSISYWEICLIRWMIEYSKWVIIDKEKRSVESVNIICWSNEFVILITSWTILSIEFNEIPEVVVVGLSELGVVVSMVKTWSESHTSFLISGLLEYNVLEMFLSIENILQLNFVKVRWDLKDDRENLESIF
jgi:hypothetical protein